MFEILYHQIKAFLTPLVGGFGPAITLIVLILLLLVPIEIWENQLAQTIGPELAAKRTAWAGGAIFLIVLLLALAWTTLQ
jgi:hypothetical protein